jgi:prefoldin subunit 5
MARQRKTVKFERCWPLREHIKQVQQHIKKVQQHIKKDESGLADRDIPVYRRQRLQEQLDALRTELRESQSALEACEVLPARK